MDQTESVQVDCPNCGEKVMIPIRENRSEDTQTTCACGLVFDTSNHFTKDVIQKEVERIAKDVFKDMKI